MPTSKKPTSKKPAAPPSAKEKTKMMKTNSKTKQPKEGTVAWLIDQLSKLPGNMFVASGDHDGYYYDCNVVRIRRLFKGQEICDLFDSDTKKKKASNIVCLSSW